MGVKMGQGSPRVGHAKAGWEDIPGIRQEVRNPPTPLKNRVGGPEGTPKGDGAGEMVVSDAGTQNEAGDREGWSPAVKVSILSTEFP